MTKKIKVGIIGTGWIANAHVKCYKQMKDVEITAAADLIPGKADEFFRQQGMEGIRTYPDHKSMLENEQLDAVSVCTYNSTHAVCTIDALEKGINVLLEKPMCVTLNEAVEICKAERRSGKVLSIGFQPRYDLNKQMIRKIVQSGELGKIYYIQTGGGRRRGIPTPFGTTFIEQKTAGIGAMGDIGCYSLDLVLHAIGYPKPLTVTGYTSDYFGRSKKYANKPEYAEIFGVEDFAAAFVRLEGGIILDFRIAWAMHIDTPGDTIIMGTEGALRIPSEAVVGSLDSEPLKVYHDIAGVQVETVIPLKTEKSNIIFMKVRDFVDAVKSGGPAPIPTSEILYNQAIIDGIIKSAKAGHELEITIPEIE
ncbi:MAG TPA: oxidoreductase [Clostridiales bacterium]|nr:oxidoreductase [Clostridiales bacterium]